MQVRGELLARQEQEKDGGRPTRYETALAVELTQLKLRVGVLEQRIEGLPAKITEALREELHRFLDESEA